MTKVRLVLLLLTNGALTFGISRLLTDKSQMMVVAWSLTLSTAAFALGVSSWRAIRAILILTVGGSGFVAALAFSRGFAGFGLIAMFCISLVALWTGWKSAPTWQKATRYEAAPQNPWTALDRGIDPTE